MMLHIVTKDSELIETISIDDCDLDSSIDFGSLCLDIKEAIKRGRRIEKDQEEVQNGDERSLYKS
ncbi:hypothetical protein LCGC14_0541760 [marine sediment metagenome]|uniref:Uncharacterized protein n=1 Tax=marine sediment metagenome TaxID=412755 RepID=A0A0F9RXA5_9ZZZZ